MKLIEVTKAFVSNCTTTELRSSNTQEAMTRIEVGLIYEREGVLRSGTVRRGDPLRMQQAVAAA